MIEQLSMRRIDPLPFCNWRYKDNIDQAIEYTKERGPCRLASDISKEGNVLSKSSYFAPHNSKTYDECKDICDNDSQCNNFEMRTLEEGGDCEIWYNQQMRG